MKSACLLLASASAFAPQPAPRVGVRRSETVSDLKELAVKLNPVIGFWDPLGLTELDLWGQGEEATIGWLRHAEIKHGRVAMAAFIGYIVAANGITFPLHVAGDYSGLDAPGVWDAVPTAGKWQIIGAVGFLEFWSELGERTGGSPHYMRGGKPGAFPSFKENRDLLPHPVPLDLWDPVGFASKASPEKKASSLVAEINNGRLAMLGIFGFLAESKIPGSVPALCSIIKPYAGDYMAPLQPEHYF